MDFFKKEPTQKELQRENDRSLRKASRDIERDKLNLEREEKKIELEIKKMAKEGNKDACIILAKQLVQLRKQKTRFVAANSKIAGVSAQNKSMSANVALAGAMKTTAQTMKNMNAVLNPQALARDMEAFKQANSRLEMTDEMIEDSLNDMLDESDDEEATEGIVSQVLDEIGIEISGKMANAPSVNKSKIGQRENADAEIEAQLARLKS